MSNIPQHRVGDIQLIGGEHYVIEYVGKFNHLGFRTFRLRKQGTLERFIARTVFLNQATILEPILPENNPSNTDS